MKFLSVDRIEENRLICEDESGKIHVIPVENLPVDVKEGSIIRLDEKGKVKIDEKKTKIRKNIILNLRRKAYDINREKHKKIF